MWLSAQAIDSAAQEVIGLAMCTAAVGVDTWTGRPT